MRHLINIVETMDPARQMKDEFEKWRRANTPHCWVDYMPGDTPDEVEIDRFEVEPEYRGTGEASRAMRMLCSLADRYGITLTLAPVSKIEGDEPGLNPHDLQDFYMRCGFEWSDGPMPMARHPRLVEDAQNDGEPYITGLRPRFEEVGLTKADLAGFAKRSASAEEFATRLAEPGTQAYSKLLYFWQSCKDEELPERTKFLIPYVGKLIAEKLGATGYKSLPKGGLLPWADRHSNLMGGNGYILTLPEGRVFLDATLENKTIYMAQISVEDRAGGLGSRVMEAIREVAQEHGWQVCVYKVVNRKFFQKFPWLVQKDSDTFVSQF